MCGISGIWSTDSLDRTNEIALMNNALKHRGPDGNGQWHDSERNIFFGHTRLSILDVSDNGMQPMLSSSSRYVMVFNGEIYNHLEIRDEISRNDIDFKWKGTSDTETILAAIDLWGPYQTCKKLLGMFAIALWDKSDQKLYLARDRVGEKPLYYFQSGSLFSFSSEPKAFSEVDGFKKNINLKSLSSFVKFSYVPDSCSIYDSVYKVQPGSIIMFSNPTAKPSLEYFWSLESVIIDNTLVRKSELIKNNYANVESETEKILSDVVSSQMISDVPIGSFLSGGIDSTLITMLMQRNSSQRVKTFSIGFKESRFNEAKYAMDIANFLDTEHTEFIVSESDVLELIPNLANVYDEPFADSSQLPTIILSMLSRKDVTVALTGDGGDEVFGGYNRHLFGPNLWRKIEAIPSPIKPIVASALSILKFIESKNETVARKILSSLGLPITFIERLFILQESIKYARSLKDLHIIIASAFIQPNEITQHTVSTLEKASYKIFQTSALEHSEQMMAFDTLSYLPGDILVKVDRASMHSSLETRAPFLDARVIEHSWKLPLKYKIHNKVGKKILRNILAKHLPASLIDRPKQGFSIPIDSWLRGELKEWAGNILLPEKTNYIGFFKSDIIEAMWKDHLNKKKNYGQQLWTIITAHLWYEKNF
jgi:asparagine synthase (glutamine-hydrolysing)